MADITEKTTETTQGAQKKIGPRQFDAQRTLEQMIQEEQKKPRKPYIVEIDGVQVFSADFVFEQMQAQGRSIDRARNIALYAALISAVAVVLVFVVVALLKQ